MIMHDVDDKLYTLTGKVDTFVDKLIGCDSRIQRIDEAQVEQAKPIMSKVELAVIQMKDYMSHEMTSIQKKLGADYELHWTKYQDLYSEVSALKAQEKEYVI